MPETTRPVYTVTQLTEELSGIFQEEYRSIAVEGEVSGWKIAPSGHAYFSIKDENALLKAVMWRSRLTRATEIPRDGQLVQAVGGLTIYPPRGEYQLDVTRITQAGMGALQQRFEELKRKLEAEGLFDSQRKRLPPLRLCRIGVVTSPHAAALRDFLRTLKNGDARLSVLILPTRVQGLEAPAEIVRAIERAGELGLDLLVVTRGGGSLEDLWAFNDEGVARAIAACPVPVISAVGHEVDFTIADFVADIRVATPTAAANLLVDRIRAVREPLLDLRQRLTLAMRDRLEDERSSLENLDHRLRTRSPIAMVGLYRRQADELLARGKRSLDHRIAEKKAALTALRRSLGQGLRMRVLEHRGKVSNHVERLKALNPQATLARGYALVETAQGARRIRRKAELADRENLRVHWADGEIVVRREE
jgi:exodeoxyribonuclease VII large subunit